MSFTKAAYEVLKSANCPLHTNEIIRRAIREGMLQTKAKIPRTTMWSSLYLENKRKHEQGKQPRFSQHGNSVWGLTEWDTK
jgi:hypothetical protein